MRGHLSLPSEFKKGSQRSRSVECSLRETVNRQRQIKSVAIGAPFSAAPIHAAPEWRRNDRGGCPRVAFFHLRGSLLSRPAPLSGRLRWRVQGSIPGEPHCRRGPLFALVWRLGLADQRCWTFDIGQCEAKPHEKPRVLVSVRLRNADQRSLRIHRHFGDRTPTRGRFSLETAGRPSRGAPSFQVRYSRRQGHHCPVPRSGRSGTTPSLARNGRSMRAPVNRGITFIGGYFRRWLIFAFNHATIRFPGTGVEPLREAGIWDLCHAGEDSSFSKIAKGPGYLPRFWRDKFRESGGGFFLVRSRSSTSPQPAFPAAALVSAESRDLGRWVRHTDNPGLPDPRYGLRPFRERG
jgi:hypothetical protein